MLKEKKVVKPAEKSESIIEWQKKVINLNGKMNVFNILAICDSPPAIGRHVLEVRSQKLRTHTGKSRCNHKSCCMYRMV